MSEQCCSSQRSTNEHRCHFQLKCNTITSDLEWNLSKGSDKLINAPEVEFPCLDSTEQRMRAATMRFHDMERASKREIDATPLASLPHSPSTASIYYTSVAASEARQSQTSLQGDQSSTERKRGTLDMDDAEKCPLNRKYGSTCQMHRKTR